MKRLVIVLLCILSFCTSFGLQAREIQSKEALVSLATQELRKLDSLCDDLHIDTLETVIRCMKDPGLKETMLRCIQSDAKVDIEFTFRLEQLSIEELQDFIGVVRSCFASSTAPGSGVNMWKVACLSAGGIVLTVGVLHFLTSKHDDGGGDGETGGGIVESKTEYEGRHVDNVRYYPPTGYVTPKTRESEEDSEVGDEE